MFYGRGAGGDRDRDGGRRRPRERGAQPAVRRARCRLHVLPRADDPPDGGDDRPVLHPACGSRIARVCSPRSRACSARSDVSIKSVWQEGTGDDAQLVFITHRAREGPFQQAVGELRGLAGRRARCGASFASRPRSRRVAQLWRGVIEEYRDRLPVTDATPVVTLGEGGTPLVRSEPLSQETGCEVWLKYEGANPTASFKDRGMTLAISKALEEGSKAVVCASTGNTSAQRGRVRGEGRAHLRRARAEGQGRARQDGRHARARRPGAGGRGELRRVARARRRARRAVPGHARELGEPGSDRRGRRPCAFEIVDALGRAPDLHCVPVGNAGNISSHWLGYSEYLRDGVIHEPPHLFGFQATGAAPIVRGEAGARSAHDRDRDPDRQPRLLGASRWRPRPSPRARSWPSPTARSSSAYRRVAREGLFAEPASAASVAGLLHLSARSGCRAGATRRLRAHRSRAEGPRVGDQRRGAPAHRPGRRRRRSPPSSGSSRCVSSPASRPRRRTSGRGSTASGSRSTCATRSRSTRTASPA